MSQFNARPVATLYRLSDLFAALQAKVAEYDGQLKNVPTWAAEHPPAASRRGLLQVMTQIEEWQEEGFEFALTERPFSDDSITGSVEDTVISQFGRVAFPQRSEACRVTPLRAGSAGRITLEI